MPADLPSPKRLKLLIISSEKRFLGWVSGQVIRFLDPLGSNLAHGGVPTRHVPIKLASKLVSTEMHSIPRWTTRQLYNAQKEDSVVRKGQTITSGVDNCCCSHLRRRQLKIPVLSKTLDIGCNSRSCLRCRLHKAPCNSFRSCCTPTPWLQKYEALVN